ncbi:MULTISPECIES: small membrane protein [Klebsiella]|nr:MULTISPECIES: small membrane protein [Klebsiella]EIW9477991.1 small membrane protein [Klebsiella aerogenes]EIW9498195.1 small membrane protein [Klebsiella aerogenes]EKM7511467.1 small membrane protein [Klebsiella aerogenes]EKW8939085.1 small membrane protein [Klebsiella aerogenes]ELT7617609.1 small membrane protein [Klebsiella aerogenes]
MENLFFVIIVIILLLLAIAVFISYIKDRKKQKNTFKKKY